MTYTRAYLKTKINAGIKGKSGMLIDQDDIVNQAAREVLSEIDVRSTEKVVSLSPNLFSDIYSYPAPTDLKAQGIIDIRPQINRTSQSEVTLTTSEEFDRTKQSFRCAVSDEDTIKRILVSIPVNDITVVVSTLDTLTSGGGTWTVVGDAINLVASSDQYVKGVSSLKYDIGSGATTTAGIQNIGLTQFDITDFLSNQIFHYVYLSDATNITNFKLRVGSSVSDYYEITVTQTHEQTAFQTGWNLLRFDLVNKTTTGTPVNTACDYVSIFMTKTVGKINQTGFYADHIWLKKGEVYKLNYYSKYFWKNTGGTYIEESTTDADFLTADSDEVDLVIKKGIELASAEVDELTVESNSRAKYTAKRDMYLDNNPSKAKLIQTTYYNY